MSACRALNRLWALACAPGERRFAHAIADAGGWQRRRLARLLARHADTAFGRAHGFAGLDAASYRHAVPVRPYEAFAPWLDRVRAGEAGVLTTDPVERLVPTGGSSGGAKLIPWTRGAAREFAAVLAPWIADLQRRHPAAAAGCAYWSVTPPGEAPPAARVPVGFADDTAYLGGPLAALVRPLLAAPTALRGIAEGAAFRYATVRCLLARADLTLVSVWHPSFLALLLDTAQAERERLTHDLRAGGCSAELPPAVRAALAPWVRPAPARAAALERADWEDPRALWPGLALVSCWADAAAALPARALGRRLRGVPLQAKGLLATEGAVSLPWRGHPVAAVTGPVIELLEADGTPRWLDEADVGGSYRVVLTTAAGLWRYDLGDLVDVTGRLGRAPCLRFRGRSGATCDLVGEKLDEAFVAACLARTLPSAGFALLAPNGDGSAGYTLFADTEADPARVEAALAANPQWRLARALGQLVPLRAVRVRGDALATVLAHRRATCAGAVKPCALDRDRAWARHLAEAA